MRKSDAILQDNELWSEEIALTKDQILKDDGAEVSHYTLHCIISGVLKYENHWVCIKWWISYYAKADR